jgi:predicted glycoside hydrolase/deacetylase ChbG (UPF0249 family)
VPEKMKRLLIRADDLGYCEGVNYGIEKSVKDGIIRSVGVMTNMPTVKHGLALLEGEKVCYGQHTNICVGHPLTDPKRIPSIVGANGEFKSSKEYRAAAKEGRDFVVLDEVILEIEAQYQEFKKLTGEEPHYFEGHAVASNNFFKGLEIVAQRHNLRYLAFTPAGAVTFGSTKLYSHCDSMLPNYDPFESLKDAMEHAHADGCEMFICHPGYLDAYILRTSSLTIPRTQEVEMVCAPETKAWLKENEVELVTYDDIP